MESAIVRKYCILQAAALVILVGLSVTLYYSYKRSSKCWTVLEALQKAITHASDEIQSIHAQEARLNNNFSVLQEMEVNVHREETREFGDGSLYSIVKNLCKKHGIVGEEVLVSDPLDISGDYKKQYTKVTKSNVHVKFKALTDQHATMLMHALRYDIPGFVAVRTFKLVKEKEITQEVVRLYNEGVVLPTVSGEAVLEVYNLHGKHL
ncbi:MAG: hypothetical protein ACTJLL_01545 [Anaplasma sp.]